MNSPSPSQQRFAGKTILITGATGDIGEATAARFVQEGAHALLVDLDGRALEMQAARFKSFASAFPADVTDEQQVQSAFNAMLASVGRIDMAVLNAGIEGRRAQLHELSAHDFDQVQAVNVRGVFLWLSRLMGHMRGQRGGVITITSSTAGLRGSVGMAPYVTSKHAVIGLMKAAALEGAAHGIRVNAIHPGPIDTRMMRSIDASTGAMGAVHEAKLKRIPLGRYGSVEEIAAMTAFLSSGEASYCTGASYVADGGIMAGNVG